MIIALWGFLAMLAQDFFMTNMVIAESRGRWVLAGLLDCVGWLAQIATISVSVTTILKHGFSSVTVVVIVAITAANFLGTGLSTLLGDRLIKEKHHDKSSNPDHSRPGRRRRPRPVKRQTTVSNQAGPMVPLAQGVAMEPLWHRCRFR